MVFEVADRITVLLHGRRAGTLPRLEATMDQVVGMMTGSISVGSISDA